MMNKKLFSLIFFVLLLGGKGIVWAADYAGDDWATDPANCVQGREDVSAPCPTEGGQQVQCSYTACSLPAAITGTLPTTAATGGNHNSSFSTNGGYIYHCLGTSACTPSPANWKCQQKTSCVSAHVETQCTGSVAGTATCKTVAAGSDSGCISGYRNCSASPDSTCEIRKNVTAAPSPAHTLYGSTSCSDRTCASGYFTVTGETPEVEGCNGHTSDLCTMVSGGLPGSCTGAGTNGNRTAGGTCTCVPFEPENFETGTEAEYTTSNPLLWGKQLGTGDLINFKKDSGNSFVVDNDANVGIGTTTPTGILSVTPEQYNTGTASQSGTTITGVGTTFTSDMVGSQFVFDDGTSAGTVTAFTSATELTVSESQTVSSQDYKISYTGLQVDATGNVGIGTATPSTRLHISDGLSVSADGQDTLELTSTYSAGTVGSGGRIVFSHTNGTEAASVRGYTFGSSETGLAFGTGWGAVTPKMVIDNAGKVGIGTTTPNEALEVVGNIRLGTNNQNYIQWPGGSKFGYLESGIYGFYTPSYDFVIKSWDGSVATYPFFIDTAGSSHTGNVGIGTTSPTAALHLKAGTTAANTAPLKFTSGDLLTTPEVGSVEFLNDAFYGTITTGAARKTFAFLESPTFTGTVSGITASMVGLDDTATSGTDVFWSVDKIKTEIANSTVTEVDTLDLVTDRGATTTNVLTVGGIVTAGLVDGVDVSSLSGTVATNVSNISTNTSVLGDKADKVSGATNGNLAGLDTNGNLTDSGLSLNDSGTLPTNLWSALKINTELLSKAPLASPTFTGTVTLPTGLTGVLRADSGLVSVDSSVSLLGSEIDISDETNLAVGDGITLTDDTLTVTAAGGLATTTGGLTTTGILEDLNTLDVVDATDGQFIVSTGTAGTFAYETGATVRTSLGLGNVTNESKATMFTNAALTGDPTAPTPTALDNDTSIATTAFVTGALGSISSDSVIDADEDTKIQVEESADEDKIRFDTAGTERMIIDENGNVGIGTSTPGQKLSVLDGRVNIREMTPSSYAVLEFGNDTSALRGGFFMAGSTATGYGGASSMNLVNLGSGAVALGTNNSIDLTIEDGGNVGIGTSSPAAALDVVGDFIAHNGAPFVQYDSVNDALKLGDVDGAGARLALYDDTSAEVMTLTNGKVGIGTTDPVATLEVESGSSETTALIYNNEDHDAFLELKTDNLAGDLGIRFNNAENPDIGLLRWENANFVFEGGNVGIGTTTPGDYRLKVDGDRSAYFTIASETSDAFVIYSDPEGENAFRINNDAKTILFSEAGDYNVGIGTRAPAGIFSVTPTQYDTGTASQLATTITGVGTTFTSAMVGSQFVFADGRSAGTITAFNSSTSLTVSVSQTVSPAQSYKISYTGLQVDTSGNVGIGTTSPIKELDVYGEIALSGIPVLKKGDRTGDNHIFVGDYAGNAMDSLGLWVDGTEILTAKGSNVGIGTTDPNEALDVVGNLLLSNSSSSVNATLNGYSYGSFTAGTELSALYFKTIVQAGNQNVGAIKLIAENAGTGEGEMGLSFSTSDSTNGMGEAMRISGDGNVGIGTTTPGNYSLNVSGDRPAFFNMADEYDDAFIIYDEADATNVLRIDSSLSGKNILLSEEGNYNVGIGTTTPTEALDVVGNIAVSGTVDGVDVSDLYATVLAQSASVFVGKTTATYTGNLGVNGYKSGNALCAADHTGSHLCSQAEILYTIETVADLSTLTGWSGDVWMSTGGAKYSPADLPVNDCNGWTHGVGGTYLGSFWRTDTTTGGSGKVSNCGVSFNLACCK